MPYSGRKPIVVCNGQAYEVADEEEGRDRAIELAGQTKMTAYLLMPALRIRPHPGDYDEEDLLTDRAMERTRRLRETRGRGARPAGEAVRGDRLGERSGGRPVEGFGDRPGGPSLKDG